MTGLILAAGSGNRLKDHFGKDVCKPLLKIAGKPLIEYSLENLFSVKVDRIFVVVGKHRREIENTIGSDYKGIPVFYVVQKQPVGLVNAMAAALGSIDDDTVLQLSDEIMVDCTADISLAAAGADFICGVTPESDAEKIKGNYSVELAENGSLAGCREKPQEVHNNLKGTGFCVFSRECMEALGRAYNAVLNRPKDLCDFINLLLEQGKRGAVLEIAAKEYNVNTAEDAALANRELQ